MGLHCDLGEIAAHSLTDWPTWVVSRDASASKKITIDIWQRVCSVEVGDVSRELITRRFQLLSAADDMILIWLLVTDLHSTHIGRATYFVVSGWQEMSKGGQKLQSGRLTHLVDQQICWYGWCWLVVPFVVSVPFDDKICWYGQAFRINILCNRPILLMEQICATVVVQFLQCSLHCAMWPVYICKGLLG